MACVLASQVQLLGDDEAIPKSELPEITLADQHVLETIKSLLAKRFPDGTLVTHFDEPIQLQDSDDLLRFQFHLRKYLSHVEGKPRQYSEKSVYKTGPASDGFDIRIYWLADCNGGAGGADMYGRVLGGEFYKSINNCYKLPDGAGFLMLGMDYGSNSDMEVMNSIRSEFTNLGQPVYDAPEDWKTKTSDFLTRLAEIVEKNCPGAIWKEDDQTISWEYKSMQFDIHTIDDKGNVSPETHPETGPQIDGLIIRITSIEQPLFRQPRPAYGRSYGPYWKHYFAIYEEHNGPLRLDILYGEKTDKKLLEEVTHAFDEMFQGPSRF